MALKLTFNMYLGPCDGKRMEEFCCHPLEIRSRLVTHYIHICVTLYIGNTHVKTQFVENLYP